MDINEIARLAGVSRATVSRYLNDGYVSQAKREQIGRVIEETGYVPSRQARQLRTGKTGLIGVIIPKINSQSVSRMVAGISDVLSESNYQTLLANTNNDWHAEVEYLRVFSEKNRVDGIIIIASVISDEHREIFSSLNVPLVILGQHVEGHDCVYHDDYHATYEVTKLALATAKAPAYIGVLEGDWAAGHMRHQGFLDACAEAGIVVEPSAQVVGDFTMDGGYFGCEQILDAHPNIDAIVCATDTMAFGALTCLREYGHSVPDEIQVTGIGDSEFSRAVSPALTTAHLFFKTSGANAALMLLSALGLRKGHATSRELKMGYEIYARGTTR